MAQSENQKRCSAAPAGFVARDLVSDGLRRMKNHASTSPSRKASPAAVAEADSEMGTAAAARVVHGKTSSRKCAKGILMYPPAIERKARTMQGMSMAEPGFFVTGVCA